MHVNCSSMWAKLRIDHNYINFSLSTNIVIVQVIISSQKYESNSLAFFNLSIFDFQNPLFLSPVRDILRLEKDHTTFLKNNSIFLTTSHTGHCSLCIVEKCFYETVFIGLCAYFSFSPFPIFIKHNSFLIPHNLNFSPPSILPPYLFFYSDSLCFFH